MTTYSSAAVNAGIMPDYSKAGVLLSRTAVFTLGTDTGGISLAAADVVQMVPIPKGAQIINILCENNCGLGIYNVEVGDGNSNSRFFGYVFTGVIMRNDFFNANTLARDPNSASVYTYTEDDTIDWTFLSSGLTEMSGFTIAMTVIYKMEGEIKDEDF